MTPATKDGAMLRMRRKAATSDKLRRRPLYRKVGKVSEFYPKEVVEASEAYYEALRQHSVSGRAIHARATGNDRGIRILHG